MRLIRATCAILTVCATLGATSPAAIAAESANVCTRASLTNPDASVAGSGGMGGTGAMAGAGGMGGTGVMADAHPVVPGTGGMGGTGIVGMITGFASICVNGAEVHYDANTPVSVNGRAGTVRDLAVGHVVVVRARIAGGQLQAGGIGVMDAVSGPITRVNAATREVQVMGQTVRADTTVGADLSNLRVGSMARVSGHRADNGDIIATRIDTGTGAGTSVLGTVTRVEANALLVNGTRVQMGGRNTQGITTGSEVFVSGEWTGSALQARRVDAQPVRNALARSERAILEGYVRGKTSQELTVGGVTVRLDERVRYNGGNARDADVGRKVQIEVHRSGSEWQAERVILQRDDRNTRPGRDGQAQGGSNEGSGSSGSGSSGSSGSGSSGSGSSGSGSSGSGSSGSGNSGGSSSGSSGTSGHSTGSNSGSSSSRSGRR